MPEFEILEKGSFDRDHILINYQNTEMKLDKEVEELVEITWNLRKNTGTRLYDGKLFRVVSQTTTDKKIFLKLENTSYKYFVASRTNDFVSRFGIELSANPLSVGAVVVGRDNSFFAGRRRCDLDFNPGMIGLVAGIMERDKDLSNGQPNPFGAILRELSEETNVRSREVENIICLGLIYNIDYHQTYMPFEIKLEISLKEMLKRLPSELEFKEYYPIPTDFKSVEEFLLENTKKISQTCIGNILLFGRKEFGHSWFKEMLEKICLRI